MFAAPNCAEKWNCMSFQHFLYINATRPYCSKYRPISAGFTNRLYRLKPRASRSKRASKNCGTHRFSGRYM